MFNVILFDLFLYFVYVFVNNKCEDKVLFWCFCVGKFFFFVFIIKFGIWFIFFKNYINMKIWMVFS